MLRTREVVLVAAGAGFVSTALVVIVPGLHFAYRNPDLHVALLTAELLIALLCAYLMFGRFQRPLGLLVPVQLADPARLQAHVHPGERLRDRELALRYLARPAPGQEAVPRCRERELEVRDRPGVGVRRREQCGVLALQRDLRGPRMLAPVPFRIGSGRSLAPFEWARSPGLGIGTPSSLEAG